MSKFEPFTDATPLPKKGAGYERAILDLKWDTERTTDFHKAKDVAAFANYLGGTLLIGVEEEHGCVKEYHPLTAKDVDAVQTAFSKAVGYRCAPPPVVDSARIRHEGGFVLALNVWPHLSALVGVKVDAHKPTEGYGGTSYAFPIRTLTDTIFLTAEQLPMFMQPSVRRAVVLLQSIPKGARIVIHNRAIKSGNVEELTGIVGVDVDELKNVARFKFERSENLRMFPLDLIVSVFEDGNVWTVLIRHWGL